MSALLPLLSSSFPLSNVSAVGCTIRRQSCALLLAATVSRWQHSSPACSLLLLLLLLELKAAQLQLQVLPTEEHVGRDGGAGAQQPAPPLALQLALLLGPSFGVPSREGVGVGGGGGDEKGGGSREGRLAVGVGRLQADAEQRIRSS